MDNIQFIFKITSLNKKLFLYLNNIDTRTTTLTQNFGVYEL